MDVGLAELHTHLGGSVSSDALWSLAHRQGIALPVKDFWDFDRLVTVSDPRGVPDLDALDAIYHWTELIQSSPAAVEVSVHGAIGGQYGSLGGPTGFLGSPTSDELSTLFGTGRFNTFQGGSVNTRRAFSPASRRLNAWCS